MKQYLQLLNQMKKASEVDSQMIASLVDYRLTSEQIESMLAGDESLFTTENKELLEMALLKAYIKPVERLREKLIDILSNKRSVNRSTLLL
jgi:hypothetical protein